jgi:hypothetical protein
VLLLENLARQLVQVARQMGCVIASETEVTVLSTVLYAIVQTEDHHDELRQAAYHLRLLNAHFELVFTYT